MSSLIFPIATGLAGGLALFLFGMHLISTGLQKAAARQVQQLLGAVTKNRFFGMLAGLVVTIFLQTSAVTTVLLVGFVSAELMSLGQALGVILGAAIGSTLTAQLIALRLSDYALWAVAAGLIPYILLCQAPALALPGTGYPRFWPYLLRGGSYGYGRSPLKYPARL